MHCVERVRLPEYPLLGLQARISGDVRTVVHLNQRGAVDSIDAEQESHSLLYDAVSKALRDSSFAAGCHDRAVTLVFRFVLEREGTDTSRPPKLYFGYPNVFWIVGKPINWQP
jgi:hypothetical protein